jgi:hypothetical protein
MSLSSLVSGLFGLVIFLLGFAALCYRWNVPLVIFSEL